MLDRTFSDKMIDIQDKLDVTSYKMCNLFDIDKSLLSKIKSRKMKASLKTYLKISEAFDILDSEKHCLKHNDKVELYELFQKNILKDKEIEVQKYFLTVIVAIRDGKDLTEFNINDIKEISREEYYALYSDKIVVANSIKDVPQLDYPINRVVNKNSDLDLDLEGIDDLVSASLEARAFPNKKSLELVTKRGYVRFVNEGIIKDYPELGNKRVAQFLRRRVIREVIELLKNTSSGSTRILREFYDFPENINVVLLKRVDVLSVIIIIFVDGKCHYYKICDEGFVEKTEIYFKTLKRIGADISRKETEIVLRELLDTI